MTRSAFNSKILVIDDEELVRTSIQSTLQPRPMNFDALGAASARLFDDRVAPPPTLQNTIPLLEFHVDVAANGQSGYEMVQRALASDAPYAAIFLDMRMPGWDGLRTAREIRLVDERVEIIIITAHTEYSLADMNDIAGSRVGYYLKPFAPDEIKQVATKAVYDWNKLRDLEGLVDVVSHFRIESTRRDALGTAVQQAASSLGAHSLLLLEYGPDADWHVHEVFGHNLDESSMAAVLTRLPIDAPTRQCALAPHLALFPLAPYYILTVSNGRPFDDGELYLLELLAQHVSHALERVRMREQLARTEKLSAIGMAIARVVHDLRVPIGNIQSLVKLVRSPATGARERNELHELIELSASDAWDIVNELLDFTRDSPVVKTPVATSQLMAALIRNTDERVALLGVQLTCVDEHGGTVYCDGHKISRVLINLVLNAAEALAHAPDVGTAASVSVRIAATADEAIFEVSDNGPGIPGHIASTLFEPFVSAGKEHGTGLGLTVVRQIVEAHGGTIAVTSKGGPERAGTDVTVRIPSRLLM